MSQTGVSVGRRLHLGCGQNVLPRPWENFDLDIDIRQPLPFDFCSVEFILAEHVIEHIDFRSGIKFLSECLRVLEPGGKLRLAFPDITREIPLEDYRSGFSKHYNRQLNCREDVWLSVLIDWEHQSCWTREMAERVLVAVGFDRVSVRDYGYSPYPELTGIDGHHLSVGLALARAETTVLEATR